MPEWEAACLGMTDRWEKAERERDKARAEVERLRADGEVKWGAIKRLNGELKTAYAEVERLNLIEQAAREVVKHLNNGFVLDGFVLDNLLRRRLTRLRAALDEGSERP